MDGRLGLGFSEYYFRSEQSERAAWRQNEVSIETDVTDTRWSEAKIEFEASSEDPLHVLNPTRIIGAAYIASDQVLNRGEVVERGLRFARKQASTELLIVPCVPSMARRIRLRLAPARPSVAGRSLLPEQCSGSTLCVDRHSSACGRTTAYNRGS